MNGNGNSSHSTEMALDNTDQSKYGNPPSSPRPLTRRKSITPKRKTGNLIFNVVCNKIYRNTTQFLGIKQKFNITYAILI